MRKRKGALLRISIEIETTKKSLFYLLAQSVSVYPTSNVGTLVILVLLSWTFPGATKVPSPNWRSFLHNHLTDIAAIDMFVVTTATFQLLYALIVLGHDRRKVIHVAVTHNPTQVWLAHQMTEAFPWDTAPRYLLRDRDASYGLVFRDRVRVMGIKEAVTVPRSP